MTTIRDAIRIITQDQTVTQAEYEQTLKPLVEALPIHASAEARELVALFADDSFQIDRQVQSSLRDELRTRGYDAPTTRPSGVDTQSLTEAIIASNVSETDHVFKDLQARAGLSDSTVTVAVMDTGLDVQHEALQEKLWVNEGEIADDGIDNDGNGYVDDINGYDFNRSQGLIEDSGAFDPTMLDGWISNPDDPALRLSDFNGHGTHVSGIITKGSDSIDVMGMTLLAGGFSGELAAEAMDYAAANGAKIVNMSIMVKNPRDVAAMIEGMKRNPDVLFVASAGNEGFDINTYRAEAYLKKHTLDNFIVVSAADQDTSKAAYSNYGQPWATHADIGSDVLATTPNGAFDYMTGTSMASPNTGAAAAKAMLMDPGLSTAEIKDLLALTTPHDPEWDLLVNAGGLVDAQAAYTVAGLTGLVRREGLTLEAAAEQLGLDAETFEALRPIAERFVPKESIAPSQEPRPAPQAPSHGMPLPF